MFPESYLSCLNASVCAKSLVRLLVMLWTASQSPLSMGFSRQEYWSGLPFPPAGDLSHPGIKPWFLMSTALAGGLFITRDTWEANNNSAVQFSSVTQSCLTLCDPMDSSMPGLPVHHQHLELTQTHVHRVSDASQPSHPLLFPSPPAFNLSQHHGLF